MDSAQTGKFIAQLRKEKGLTQSKLGELLGVTNKTVSRWENGNYMPDLSLIQPLCSILDISVNEFFFGRRLDDSAFRKIADNNLSASMEQFVMLKKAQTKCDILYGCCVGALLGAQYSLRPEIKAISIFAALGIFGASLLYKHKIDHLINHMTADSPSPSQTTTPLK